MEKMWNIGWGPISFCNMNCQFCYSKNVRTKSIDLKIEDWKNFINKNHMYINSINYGTGENTISTDWYELVNYISSNYGIKQALTTNGFLYEQVKNNESNSQIIVNSISEIDVSLDFSDKEKHNAFRGQENAYDWAINTLKYCQEKDIISTIVFIGTNDTIAEDNLEGLFEISKKYNSKLRMNIFRPTMSLEKAAKFICDYERLVYLLKYVNDNHKILAISDPLFSSVFTNGFIEEDPSGVKSLRILPNGNITPSTYMISDECFISNILDEDALHKAQQNLKSIIKPSIPQSCHNCIYQDSCKGGVLDRRYLWYKNVDEERDPYCPLRHHESLPDLKVNIDTSQSFTSVHHGYLPTFFFSY